MTFKDLVVHSTYDKIYFLTSNQDFDLSSKKYPINKLDFDGCIFENNDCLNNIGKALSKQMIRLNANVVADIIDNAKGIKLDLLQFENNTLYVIIK